jgi:hypothetical protein
MPSRNPHTGAWKKRYEKYRHAKTWGQYIEKGVHKTDIPYDVLRGIVRFRGPFRRKCLSPEALHQTPRGKAKHPADAVSAGYFYRGDEDAIKEIYKHRELFKNNPKMYRSPRTLYDMIQLKKSIGIENIKEIAHHYQNRASERSAIVIARNYVDALAKKILQSGRKITGKILLDLLRKWAYADNTQRLNVMPPDVTSIYSDNLGVLRNRRGPPELTKTTKKYINWYRLLSKYIADNYVGPDKERFRFTSICLNKNYAAKKHKDKGNFGPSVIVALGDFNKGELKVWGKSDEKNGKDVDIRNRFLFFDGNNSHSVNPYVGKERYSLVYFTVKGFDKVASADRKFITRHSSEYPSRQYFGRILRLAPAP